jgi:hypothetical protein
MDDLIKRANQIATTEKTLSAVKFADIIIEFYIRLYGLSDIMVSARNS